MVCRSPLGDKTGSHTNAAATTPAMSLEEIQATILSNSLDQDLNFKATQAARKMLSRYSHFIFIVFSSKNLVEIYKNRFAEWQNHRGLRPLPHGSRFR